VTKVTEATEQIKAKISDTSLSKQKHDDMKRETALEMMRVFGTMQEAAVNLYDAIFALNRLPNQPHLSDEERQKTKLKYDVAYKQFQAG
jgi:hypothetical protein